MTPLSFHKPSLLSREQLRARVKARRALWEASWKVLDQGEVCE